ncbi:trigger factor [Deinococcus aquiradiocola]|uniref:Trigger factor n=1 Tax=Deinococcus aquiradiocola TaxID=393059 RepID=A0A917PIS8_9DEIO|nr:trigger factor [Deinococcus aquiradiocola]GGJ80212.1 trigger factor [Deinococcus aquiradiocola]
MAELVSQNGNKVEFKVTVPAAEVSRAYQQVWTAISRDVRVPGFRPGKAPRSVLAKRVGMGYVDSEVRDRLLEVHYPQAARELKLNLVDASIDPGALKDGQAFDFGVTGETYPQVKLGDWKGVSLSAQAPEITDEVLEQTLTDLRERNATFESVERPIEASDMVTIQELAEGSEEQSGSYPVYLDMAEAHVRDALVGKNKGDEVEITVPAHQHGDHEHPAHTVKVRVEDVKHKQLQALDDEFAKSLNFESLDRLRSDLKTELETRAGREGDTARREEFVTALTEGMEVEIPQALLGNRREAMLEEIQADLSRQGVKWSEYESFMQEQGKLDEFMADLAKNAETRVRRDLALEQLAEDQGLQLTDTQFNAALSALAQSNNMTVQQLRTQLGPNGLNGYYASIVREQALSQAISQLGQPETAEQKDAPAEETETAPTETAE